MRYLIFLLSFFLMVGCFDEGSSGVSSPSDTTATATAIHLSGKLNLTNAGSINPTNITLSVAGITTHPNSDGSYVLAGNFNRIAGRVAGSDDSVKVIIGSDTMIEIPVISWKGILPDAYIVQRNISCVVPKKYGNKTVEVVYWDNDSIAHVLNIGTTTATNKYSGYIYTAYNDSQFINHSTIYNLFARIKNDSVVAYTEIANITANVGNLDFDSTQFIDVNKYVKYFYTIVPNDSSVKKYDDTTFFKKLVADTMIMVPWAFSFNSGMTYVEADSSSVDAANVKMLMGKYETSLTTSYDFSNPDGSGAYYEYAGVRVIIKPNKTFKKDIVAVASYSNDSVVFKTTRQFYAGVVDTIVINIDSFHANHIRFNFCYTSYDYIQTQERYRLIQKYWE